MKRKNSLFLSDGSPRWVRCWDNGGKTWDRYTVQYTRANGFGMKGRVLGIGMSCDPCDPQGFGQHFDYPACEFARSHGKRISFRQLPQDCQKLVMSDYRDLWEMKA